MKLAALLIAASLISVSGCQFSSHAPNPQWLVDFQNTDSILIRNHDDQCVISDAETISRLRKIYENAKWRPYCHTLPGDLGDRTIELLDGKTSLRRFSFTGSLWECKSYTENRTAELSDSDVQWIESLFALVSVRRSPPAPEAAKRQWLKTEHLITQRLKSTSSVRAGLHVLTPSVRSLA